MTATLAAIAFVVAAGGCSLGPPERVTEICDNHQDDDGDGKVDCEDTDCKDHPPVCMAEICDNNRDEDGDGQFDCADSDCFGDPMCHHDNCGNGSIDTGEDCDGTELGGKTCVSQGFGGGVLVCTGCHLDDSGCTNQQLENCTNGSDDDHDGKIDCDDSDCTNHPHCRCGNNVVDGDGEIFEVCDGTDLAGQTCEQLGFPPGGMLACKPDCSAFETSQCAPAVCGDGFVSPGETCDDGNTTPGDGCDASCAIEVDNLCHLATTLAPGANAGDNSHGAAFFQGNCAAFGGHEQVFTFTPAQAGTLTLVLASSIDLGLYVRTTCADAASEVACTDLAPGGANESVSVPVQPGVPLTVVVDSSLGEAGPFTLYAFQTP
jgi:cysteine-rich repeat protein